MIFLKNHSVEYIWIYIVEYYLEFYMELFFGTRFQLKEHQSDYILAWGEHEYLNFMMVLNEKSQEHENHEEPQMSGQNVTAIH